MNDEILYLRDHRFPCEHDEATPIGPSFPVWGCTIGDWCPGGREIRLRQTTLKDHTVKPDDTMYVETTDGRTM